MPYVLAAETLRDVLCDWTSFHHEELRRPENLLGDEVLDFLETAETRTPCRGQVGAVAVTEDRVLYCACSLTEDRVLYCACSPASVCGYEASWSVYAWSRYEDLDKLAFLLAFYCDSADSRDPCWEPETRF
jgi:hypothetical protein